MRSLLDRRLPFSTRLDLLTADARRRWAPRELYGARYGAGRVYLSHADYGVDRASFAFAVTEATYATDYDRAVVLDVGAHKGYFGAYAVAHGATSIVAYEPEPANLAVLERTAMSYRDGAEWTICPAAVDATSGRSDLHVMGASWGHALEPPKAFAEHEVGVESVKVEALADTLAGAAAHSSGRRLVVKMNIEGGECSAILGTNPSAWRDVAEVFVETHPWASCGAAEIAAQLGLAGLSRVASAHPAVVRMRREELPRSGRRSDPT